jgi:tetratricopeptide (TPR) repeat protein
LLANHLQRDPSPEAIIAGRWANARIIAVIYQVISLSIEAKNGLSKLELSRQNVLMDVLEPGTATDASAIFDRLTEQMEQQLATDRPDLSQVLADLLAIPPERIEHADDAVQFLHLLAFLSRGPVGEADAWQWATAVAKPHPRDAGLLSMLASLGDLLRTKDGSTVAGTIQLPELDAMFRLAMDVTPDQPGAFARAGLFYLNNQNDAEAERCLRRAFDLDPRNAFVAIQLADLFARTDRPIDGLSVLEKSIAQQADPDAELLWKAGLAAISLARWESALFHLTQLAGIEPERRWLHYYRAIALLGLERWAEAAAAIDLEAAIIKMPGALHVHTVRAAAAAGIENLIALRRHIDDAVAPPLGIVNYLAQSGIVGCFTRLWQAARQLPADDPSRRRLQERLLWSGLTPAEFWDQIRAGQDKIKGMRHFWVDLRQPLDDRWPRTGSAMPGQERWKAYTMRYGVLAADETEAAQQALQWQSHSAPMPAKVISVVLDGGPYTDVPGVTQRGFPKKSE